MSKLTNLIMLLLCLSLLWGCSTATLMKQEREIIDKEASQVKPPVPRELPPVAPPAVEKKPDPLAGKTITLSASRAKFSDIFSAIAEIAGLDLVIDSRLMNHEEMPLSQGRTQKARTSSAQAQTVSTDNQSQGASSGESGGYSQANYDPIGLKTVNVAFNRTPLEQALQNLTESLNIFSEVRGRCLYVSGTASRTYHLNFIASQKETKIGLGGDVLNSGSTGSSGGSGSSGGTTSTNPIMGMFSIQAVNTTSSNDIYAQVEQVVKSSMTEYGSYSLNRAIGFLEVNDRKNAVDRIESYIKTLKTYYNSQVLITAKILEVSLNDSSIHGIDWTSLNGYIKGYHFNIQQNLNFSSDTLSPALILNAQKTSSGMDITLEALQRFGDIKVLSNPRIRVSNGQPALISVGTNKSYIEKIEKTMTTVEGQTDTDYEVTIGSIFDGIMFGVQPYIDLDSNEVNLSITPIKNTLISIEEKTVGNDIGMYSLPTIDLKEATTQLRVKSGDMAVLGGLISKNTVNQSKGIPILGTLPVLEYLFSQKTMSVETNELVILLEPVIVER